MSDTDLLQRAGQITARYGQQVGELGLVDILHELDWLWAMYYDEEGLVKLTGLNNLQKVGLAAVMKAYAEGLR